MSTIPNITHKDIQQWTDEGSFQRGSRYFQDSAIYNQYFTGMTLKSKCSGTQASFYRQEVTFHEKGIQSAKCSCPVGSGDHCKHIVALLLTWVENQKSFQPVENIDAVLATKSQAELIAIIHRLIAADPDLEDLVSLPVASENNKTLLDLKAIQRQVSQAQRQLARNYWEDHYHPQISGFQTILTLANDYLAQNDAISAISIYMILCNALLEEKEILASDEEGELSAIIIDCLENLRQYLPTITDSNLRRQIFEVLFSVYEQDTLELGGIGLSDNVPEIFSQQSLPHEKMEIIKWLEEALPEGKGWSVEYSQRRFGKILLELKRDQLDDEGYLVLCRKTKRIHDLVERLLERRRLDEALQESQTASDHDLLELADIFVHYQHPSLAEELIFERAKTSKDISLLNWLKSRAEEKGRTDELLALTERIFWQRPNLDSFKEMARCARKAPSNWDEKRQALLSKLESDKKFELLMEISLDSHDICSALTIWKKWKTETKRHSANRLLLKLVEAAKKEFPHEAINLYLQLAHSVIANRTRQDYAEAAKHLKEVKALYSRLGEEDLWNTPITNLRTQYRTLNAFKDELKKAKL